MVDTHLEEVTRFELRVDLQQAVSKVQGLLQPAGLDVVLNHAGGGIQEETVEVLDFGHEPFLGSFTFQEPAAVKPDGLALVFQPTAEG